MGNKSVLDIDIFFPKIQRLLMYCATKKRPQMAPNIPAQTHAESSAKAHPHLQRVFLILWLNVGQSISIAKCFSCLSLPCLPTAFKCTGNKAKDSLKWQYPKDQKVCVMRFMMQ